MSIIFLREWGWPVSDELKTVRIQVMMTPSEVAALDEWVHEVRAPSRSEAVRHLVRTGLQPKKRSEIKDAIATIERAFRREGRTQEETDQLHDLMRSILRRILLSFPGGDI